MKKLYLLGLCGLLAASITSCKDDAMINDTPDIEVGGETGYLAFTIKSANSGSMTRAWLDNDAEDGDYSTGVEASGKFAHEDAIVDNVQANRVFFFSEGGGYHSSSLLSLTKAENNSHVGDDSHADTYAELVYSATVKRTGDRGDEDAWPTQCLIILNGRPSRLNALLSRAQGDPSFNMDKFLAWVNEDFRDTDVTGEGLTLGLYNYKDAAKEGDEAKYYFTMTNSIFVDGDNKHVTATQIDAEKHLKTTSEDAAKSPVTVYVERIMSKVEVGFSGYDNANTNTGHFSEEMQNPYQFVYTFSDDHETNAKWFDEDKTITMKALITNWTINAVEYQTKLFKEINPSWTATTLFDGWNDNPHHRSYWAIDAHYLWGDGSEYPTQYRNSFKGTASPYQVTEGWGSWGYGKSTAESYDGNDVMDPEYPWALDYKAFNAITNKRQYKYCLENTFSYDAESGTVSADYKHMIMGSHVLIAARLLTEEEAGKLPSTASEDALDGVIGDKYYYSDRYYDEPTYINRQIAVLNDILSENVGEVTVTNLEMWGDTETNAADGKFKFDNIAGGLWVKDGETYKQVVANPKNANEIAATDVFCIAPAYVAKGDGKVTIALKDTYGPTTSGKYGYDSQNVNLYYVTEAGVTEQGQPNGTPVQFTRNQLVSLIYEKANVADCFKNGRMYYAVPIQHHLAASITEAHEYEYKYDGLKTGDYGVVRNHWYKFVVSTIMKPGIPVHDPNQPIIPNYDDTDRYIGLEVVILPWHIVNNGDVTLGQN